MFSFWSYARDFGTNLTQIFVIFKTVLNNFVYNVKAYIKLFGKHTSWTLANMVSTIVNIFDHFWSLDGLFRTCHNPSNIIFFLLNPIKPSLKFIKWVLNAFGIIFQGSEAKFKEIDPKFKF